MIRRRLFMLALTALAPGVVLAQQTQPTVQPATQPGEQPPMSMAQAKLTDSLATAAEMAPLPRIRAKDVAEVVRLTIRDKDLYLATSLPATEGAAVEVPGLPGATRVVVTPADDTKDAPLKHFELRNFDYTTPNAVSINTAVWQAIPGRLDITQDYNLLSDEAHSVHLIQNMVEMAEGEPRVILHVQLTGQPDVQLQLAADSIVELRHRYPAEVAKYLDPVFRTLRQDGLLAKVDPKLAWQVFGDDYKPSSELVAQVQTLLKKLDAENFQDREAASKALAALDQPAALALRRMDRTGWSEEQIGRVDAFLAKFKPTNDVDAKRLRRDRDFLLDCLFSDDAQIRQLAFNELQTVVGRRIEFNLTAPPQERLEAIQRLRVSIGAPPTTHAKSRAE